MGNTDRPILVGVITLLVASLGYAVSFPWGGSPDMKLGTILHSFDRYKGHLERLCSTHAFQPGTLSFDQTGIPTAPYIHKRLAHLKVHVSVVAPEQGILLLTVTLPEITADGLYAFVGPSPIPAGATLRTRGRCERGTVEWAQIQSTIPEERRHAALRAELR